jgi:hypothetical protein
VSNPDAEEFWHAVIEKHRVDEGSFDRQVFLVVAVALAVSAEADASLTPERMLLCFREWYGPRFERHAVRALMTHLQDPGHARFRRIASAVWENHGRGCPDPTECSLHSVGTLWAYSWLDPSGDDGHRVVAALRLLVTEHPLRGWARSLVHTAARWVAEGWMHPEDAEFLISSAVDAGLHEHLANNDLLTSAWTRLLGAMPPEPLARLLRTGNRIVAAGGTCLIGPQLSRLQN